MDQEGSAGVAGATTALDAAGDTLREIAEAVGAEGAWLRYSPGSSAGAPAPGPDAAMSEHRREVGARCRALGVALADAGGDVVRHIDAARDPWGWRVQTAILSAIDAMRAFGLDRPLDVEAAAIREELRIDEDGSPVPRERCHKDSLTWDALA